MALKITQQGKKYLVRRWKYSPEKKRSMPTTVFTTSQYGFDERLPDDVIEKFNVSEEEHQSYIDYFKKVREDRDTATSKWSLLTLNQRLEESRVALEDAELKVSISLDEYEKLSETIGEIKKVINKNKNELRRKARAAAAKEA